MTGRCFAGLILAAGASTRMPGRSKLARAWSDTTVLGAVLRNAAAANLDPLFVVCSASRPDLESEGRLTVVRVPGPDAGNAASLAAGLSAMPEGPIVVLLGDEPGVRPADIRALVGAWDPSVGDMARLRYADRPGHPVLLGSSARVRAQQLTGELAVWDTLVAEGFEAVEITVEGSAPIDVDSPSDLRRARRGQPADGGRG